MNKKNLILWSPVIFLFSVFTLYGILFGDYEFKETLVYFYSGTLIIIGFYLWIDYWSKK
jgi:hypothetical protein